MVIGQTLRNLRYFLAEASFFKRHFSIKIVKVTTLVRVNAKIIVSTCKKQFGKQLKTLKHLKEYFTCAEFFFHKRAWAHSKTQY